MNEEIKEILEQLQKYLESQKYYEKGIVSGSVLEEPLHLRYLKVKILLNYITNLQKENQNLKNQLDFIDEQNKYIDKLEKMIKDYKSRNEKAIEWCECVVNAKYTADKLPNGKTTDMGYCLDLAEPLLNILQGGDE